MDQDFADCDVVVTFGYALVQVKRDPAALEEFAGLIRCLSPSRSRIVVAADAHRWSQRDAFGPTMRGTGGLVLNNSGVGLEDCCVLPDERSVMFARLKMG